MIGSGEGHHLGFRYILAPAAAGAQILLTVALPINNVARSRRYPEIWL
ncbi:MAG: HPP family protein [Dechloromonas sp.]|nr:MAG: HPP family protein [Dechloromonas sp.]